MFVFSLGVFVLSEQTEKIDQWLHVSYPFFTIIFAAITLNTSIFTWQMVEESRKHREQQLRPYIVVDFESSGENIYLTIENIGSTPALDVKVDFNPDMQVKDIREHCKGKVITNLPLLSQGIPFFPPNKVIRIFYEKSSVFFKKDVEDRIKDYQVDIRYQEEITGANRTEAYILDPNIIEGTLKFKLD